MRPKLFPLDRTDRDLILRAKRLLQKRRSDISGVSAAVRASDGKVFLGLDLDPGTATVGLCAEYAAIGAMVTSGKRGIETMVAIAYRGDGKYAVLPPCGKCRDLAREFGDPYAILQTGREITDSMKTRVSELVPYPWDKSKT